MINVSKTLSMGSPDKLTLSMQAAQEYGRQYAKQYSLAEPFPHIVIDNFLPEKVVALICNEFPVKPTESEVQYESSYTGFHKRQISPYACSHSMLNLFLFFNSAPMLQLLEQLTSIKGLIPDAYFGGGGLHETTTGGKLGVHSDFRVNESLNLERRLNLIIYLNDEWQEEYGGNLELWNPDMTARIKSIAPIRNRCVIFNTDPDSNHGHPDPLNTPAGISRRSIALYYYTASDLIFGEIENNKTHYKARPGDNIFVKWQIKNRERRDRRKTRAAWKKDS